MYTTIISFRFLRILTLALFAVVVLIPVHAQKKTARPDNIILLIGDGMGVAQVYAGLTANHGVLNISKFKSIGFCLTYSASDYITDSGASGTAISTGYKTYNGAIGVDSDTIVRKTILEYAADKGLSTGLVSTSAITHATPASFVAHQASREYYENIARDFLNSGIDVFIGGGKNHFTVRKDSLDLVKALRQKGYLVSFSMDTIRQVRQGKLAGLTAAEHNPSMVAGRGDMLPVATQTAINILSGNKKGFFLMVEGSQIDWAGHANNGESLVREVIDFDKAIGRALDFAAKDGNTLVIVTADHETGGLSIVDGNFKEGAVTTKFSTLDHTGIMVPVFAWGPGAELFQGIQENTALFDIMMRMLQLSKTQ